MLFLQISKTKVLPVPAEGCGFSRISLLLHLNVIDCLVLLSVLRVPYSITS